MARPPKCTNCGSERTYYRSKTNDFKCGRCGATCPANQPARPEPDEQPPIRPLPNTRDFYNGSAGDQMGFWKKPK